VLRGQSLDFIPVFCYRGCSWTIFKSQAHKYILKKNYPTEGKAFNQNARKAAVDLAQKKIEENKYNPRLELLLQRNKESIQDKQRPGVCRRGGVLVIKETGHGFFGFSRWLCRMLLWLELRPHTHYATSAEVIPET
jgi:predicted esterase YcpF (UPF0227 family)